MTDRRERAMKPEDIARLVVERVKAGDADGVAALYEPDAVLDFPLGHQTKGRDAIRAAYQQLIRRSRSRPRSRCRPSSLVSSR
jgi:uncharacterized protein (TIGR02246 family)